MAKLSVQNNNLVLSLEWHEKIWALSGDKTFPLSTISSVEELADIRTERIGWKLAGSYLPKVVAAGLFKVKGEKRALWVHYGQRPAVIVRFNEGKYSKLIVHAENAAEAVEGLRHSLSAS